MRQPAQTETLVQPYERGDDAEAPWIRDRAEADMERESRQERRLHSLVNDLAGSLHQPAERDAGGTRRLARATDQARVEMFDKGRVRRSTHRDERPHQRDPAAWRVRLIAQDAEGRAIVEAQAARDARRQLLGADRHQLQRTISACARPRRWSIVFARPCRGIASSTMPPASIR